MLKILIVDDDQEITTSIKSGLERNGFEVDAFNDPVKAVSEYKSDKYDLMIIDIGMPSMDGFKFYQEIKNKDVNVKACFLTAFEVFYLEFKKFFPNKEVTCFIRKPITIANLVSHIKTELKIT